MQLVLIVTARCNASCAHCAPSCGPHRKEHLPRELIMRAIEQAAELSAGEQLEISITGGEPFLDFPLLTEVIRFGASRGAYMTCVSNGYWATAPGKAKELLQQLKDAGLRLLAISSSRFHEEFVSRKRVDCALNAARDIGLECVLKAVRTSADADADVDSIKKCATVAGANRTEILPLMPTVRHGVTFAESAYVTETGIPTGTCPAAVVTIAEDGQAYTCCTPGGFRKFLAVGDLSQSHLREVQATFYLGAKQQILRQHGPKYFADAVTRQGMQERLRHSYVNVCDLCTHVAADPQMSAVAESAAGADWRTHETGASSNAT
jgi:organic radical activating enzyme